MIAASTVRSYGTVGAAMALDDPPTGELLALLDDGERATLAARGRLVRFPAGTRMLHQNEPGDRVLVMRSGRAKIAYTTRDGRELVLRFCGPGELVGELSVLDGAPRLSSVTAVEPVEALVIEASELMALLRAQPSIAIKLLQTLSRRFRDADLKRIEFGASDTLERVAGRLVELAEAHGEPTERGVRVTLPLSQDDLAAWAGASRAGVAAALRALRELGLIETERRSITVRDLEALRARSVQN
jgi:CRP/FNR family transcriptional regulator, cyclic AMP receptor protein